MSGILSFVRKTYDGLLSFGLTPHIQWIIDLSLRCSLCKTATVGAQFSLPYNKAERTQDVYNLPRDSKVMCLEVNMGNSFLNFPQTTEHLVITASSQPPPAHNISRR